MDEYNFLSLEQRAKIYKIEKNKSKVFYLILFVFVLILLIRLYVFRNQINDLNLIIENNRNKITVKNALKNKGNPDKTIDTYKNIINKLKDDKEYYDFDKLVINNNIIKIENYSIDIAKATNFINYFEKNFKVLKLDMNNVNENYVNLNIELEVINNEK